MTMSSPSSPVIGQLVVNGLSNLTRARKIATALREPGYRRALWMNVLAATEHKAFGLDKHDYKTVLDVGASRGQFALVARATWPHCRIVCFEPLPAAVAKLKQVFVDDRDVTVRETALGAQAALSTLNISSRDDSSSLLPIGRQAKEYPGTAAAGVLEVPVNRISDYIDDSCLEPILLKIDVQGYELEVLRGAEDKLDRIDSVLCECSFVELYDGQPLIGAVVSYLSARGFQLDFIATPRRSASGQQLQTDVFFRRSQPA